MENSLPPTPKVLLRLQDLGSNLGPGDRLFRLISMIFHISSRQMLKSTGSRPQPLHSTFFPIHICSHHNSTLYDLCSWKTSSKNVWFNQRDYQCGSEPALGCRSCLSLFYPHYHYHITTTVITLLRKSPVACSQVIILNRLKHCKMRRMEPQQSVFSTRRHSTVLTYFPHFLRKDVLSYRIREISLCACLHELSLNQHLFL